MSQGGILSLRAALIEPERVKALVLIDTQAGVEDPNVLPGYDVMRDEWIANGPANVQEVIAGLLFGRGYDPTPWYTVWAALPREWLRQTYQCLVERDDITSRIPEITCSAIIFHGDEDQVIGLAKAEELRDGLAKCEGPHRCRGRRPLLESHPS
jgi:pimeloyl-ACP methyl ester carboxylesterase